MKRDVALVPFNEQEMLVVAADNSGGIGLKEHDAVKTPYEVVSYYGFKVAVMECLAAGASPFSVVIQNFCHDDAWSSIMTGIEKGCAEIGLGEVSITGSTESNFSINAIGAWNYCYGETKGVLPGTSYFLGWNETRRRWLSISRE